MNKISSGKVSLFLTGLLNRYNENIHNFKEINVTFKSGSKESKGTAKAFGDDILFKYNKEEKSESFSQLISFVISQLEKYESIEFNYIERGNKINITGNDKSVLMKNIKTEDTAGASPLKNDHLIEISKAGILLKEIGIMAKDGIIKNDKIEEADNFLEVFQSVISSMPRKEIINILDFSSGESHISFILNFYLTEVKNIKCNFTVLNVSSKGIESLKKISENLNYKNMEFYNADIKDFKPDRRINIVLSYKNSSEKTDQAISLGIKEGADTIIAVPLSKNTESYSCKSLEGILKHGVLKNRIGNDLINGMRALYLESEGYHAEVLEFGFSDVKNDIMIRAEKTGQKNEEAMQEYYKLMASLNITPDLYKYVNEIY